MRGFCQAMVQRLSPRFEEIDRITELNQMKVLLGMQKNRVSEAHFVPSTGYGYNDLGRDTLEEVYADIFQGEAALVRAQIASGTHALHIALSGNLRPGDTLLSPVGKPYDTLEEVIGIRDSRGSLKEYGVRYVQVELLPGDNFDYAGIEKALQQNIRMVTIQRSRGYAARKTFSVEEIGELIAFIKKRCPDVICMVDNCYGEFVEEREPLEVGADLIVGSRRRPGSHRGLYCRQKRTGGQCRLPSFIPGTGKGNRG